MEFFLPGFSVLATLASTLFLFSLAFSQLMVAATAILLAIVLFPFVALALSGAPAWMYRALLAGPFFILWRSVTTLRLRLFPQETPWVRTPHGVSK